MKILLVDDHELFREGLKLLLGDLGQDLEFVEASRVSEATRLAATRTPDLVLLDLHLPDATGLEALHGIRAACETTVIVALSAAEDAGLIRCVIEQGAAGFIPKDSSHAVMMAALRLVLAGGVYLPPYLLNAKPVPASAPAGEPHPSAGGLSGRQLEVLRRAVQGKPNKVIARELTISEATVKAHMSAAFRILGVNNRTEAVFVAARLGLSA